MKVPSLSVLICSLCCSCGGNEGHKQGFDKSNFSGNWVSMTVLDAACRQGPYFDSSLYWPITELVIDSTKPNLCWVINEDQEQVLHVLQYTSNRILIFDPGAKDSMIFRYDRKTALLKMYDSRSEQEFVFRKAEATDVKEAGEPATAFKRLLRRCWLSGDYEAVYGSFRSLDQGTASIRLEDDGRISGWDRADHYNIFINGDYASFSDHPLMILYKDSAEEVFLWDKHGDTLELYKPINMNLADEKPQFGKGNLWGTFIRKKKNETAHN